MHALSGGISSPQLDESATLRLILGTGPLYAYVSSKPQATTGRESLSYAAGTKLSLFPGGKLDLRIKVAPGKKVGGKVTLVAGKHLGILEVKLKPGSQRVIAVYALRFNGGSFHASASVSQKEGEKKSALKFNMGVTFELQ